jgi:hypothetical protein
MVGMGPDTNDPRLMASVVKAEQHLTEADSEPPALSSARYRTTGVPKVLALAGVVVGFLLLIIPGVVALRSYRRWEDGEIGTPRAAWTVLALGIGVAAAAVIWRHSTSVAAVVGLIVFVVGLSLASP